MTLEIPDHTPHEAMVRLNAYHQPSLLGATKQFLAGRALVYTSVPDAIRMAGLVAGTPSGLILAGTEPESRVEACARSLDYEQPVLI